MTTDELINAVMDWGEEKGLDDPKAQLNKVIEEVGEIAHEVSRNQYGEDFRDAIGDSLVTIIILAGIAGQDPRSCLLEAYNTIKDRKGHTANGTFVKNAEKNYKIVAYGPGKELLTWSFSGNLANVKEYLRAEGYDEIKVVEKDAEVS